MFQSGKSLELSNIDDQRKSEIQQQLMKWGRENFSDFPWRRTTNRFHALIAEIMLQRTRAEQVQPIYEIFVRKYSSVQDAARENPNQLRQLLSSLGLRWRIEKILELVAKLNSRGGKIPSSRKELTKLPGVGAYAANALLSAQDGVKAPIIDRNAVRLWGRMLGFNTDSETHRKRWFINLANQLTPRESFKEFNYAVLDFTRTICKPKPLCNKCPLTSYCRYFQEVH